MVPDVAEELLQAADQYMLEPLKRLCEAAIAADLSTDNLADVYNLSENFNAPQLGRHCMLYALEHYEELVRPTPALQKLSNKCVRYVQKKYYLLGGRALLLVFPQLSGAVMHTGLPAC